MSDTRIDYSISIRPTRLRLLTAMGVAACAVLALLALLGMLFDSAVNFSLPGVEPADSMTVHIRASGDEAISDQTTEDQAVREQRQDEIELSDVADLRPEVAPPDYQEPPTESPPVISPPIRDWRSIAGKASQEIVADQFRQEESRESMWRQSYSVMFQPAEETLVMEEEPVLADVRFIPRVHVLGIGLTIGSCFIGIPILGGPVEQRTGAITLFICAQESG